MNARLILASLVITSSITGNSALASEPHYHIDLDSVEVFGPGCDTADSLFIDEVDGAISIIYTGLQTTSIFEPVYSNCSVMFDVYADHGYRIAAPSVSMSVNYSIDDGGKGIASAKMTTLGETRTASVKELRGTDSKVITSPVALSPKYSKCGGKLKFRVAGRIAAIAPRGGDGFATVIMDDANTENPYSIKCHINPQPC